MQSTPPEQTAVTPSPILGLVYSQDNKHLTYTDEAGIKTVTLNNEPFQILFPEQIFSYMCVRIAPNDAGDIVLAGNSMALYRAKESPGSQMVAVMEGDDSVNCYGYDLTIATGTMLTLNFRDIYWRYGSKVQPRTLFMRVYMKGSWRTTTQETIKIILK